MRRSAFLPPSLLLFLALSPAACGPATPAPKPPVVAPPATAKAPPAESPARWELHAGKAANLRAKLELSDGGTLYVGDGGERWLDKHDAAGPIAAATLLPESIAAVAHGTDGKGIAFVGASGAVYTASDPLGAVTGSHAATIPLRSITAGRAAIFGIANDGSLMRTGDAGGSWTKVALPAGGGTLVSVVMNDQGAGVALYAPQRTLATTDDGATWAAIATPGIGAKRLVLDVNGDLMLEGLEASAVLRTSPARFERVSRAAKTEGFDLSSGSDKATLSFAHAVTLGHGAFIGQKYVEILSDPEDPTRWLIAMGPLGSKLEPKKVPELNGCMRVFLGGDEASVFVACDQQQKVPINSGSYDSAPKPYNGVPLFKIYRSDDETKSWHEDGTVGSESGDVGHVWVTPDHSLILDGACKKAKYGCTDSPPLVRLAGAKSFAKLDLPKNFLRVSDIAFGPSGTRAYTMAKGYSGPLTLLISQNGAKDFTKAPLPSPPVTDEKKDVFSASKAEAGSITVDESGVVYASAHVGTTWVIYTTKDDGATIDVKPLAMKADAVELVGKHGFAYERHGRGWESSDGGVTWSEVGAPAIETGGDHDVACGTYGCLIGDRATRIGWGATAVPTMPDGGASSKTAMATPMKCTVDASVAWTPLGSLENAPSAYEADPAAGWRWMAIKEDPTKGSVGVVLGKIGAKGAETKEISLFGPAGKDVATAVLPQVEGVAAIRYSFKRDKAEKSVTSPPISADQKVDVEVAWMISATGKVQHATIMGAGPLDPRDVVAGGKDAAHASVGLLSIAQGGVHVRPFATKPEAPLYFVHDGGKVDRLSWPELPTKDAGGGSINLRVDAVRVGTRSVVLGVTSPGLQLWSAWANDTGTSWESRSWGIWPELGPASMEVGWDFTYLAGKPAILTFWPGGGGIDAVGWAVPIKASETDPSEIDAVATQRSLSDPPKACDAGAIALPRVIAPFVHGTRHPIVISGDGEIVLATGSAVLHGTGGDACVQAYEARPASTAAMSTYAAIVSPDDLTHAALFKTLAGGQEVSVHGMTCAFAPGPVPPALVGTEGFE